MISTPQTRNITLALSLLLTALPAALARAQPPECAYFLYAAQDYVFIKDTKYTASLSTLFTGMPDWDNPDVCSGFEISGTAPQSLNNIGNNMIHATNSTFTAYVWNQQEAWRITPLAVEPYAPTGATPTSTPETNELPIIVASTPEPLEPVPVPDAEPEPLALEDLQPEEPTTATETPEPETAATGDDEQAEAPTTREDLPSSSPALEVASIPTTTEQDAPSTDGLLTSSAEPALELENTTFDTHSEAPLPHKSTPEEHLPAGEGAGKPEHPANGAATPGVDEHLEHASEPADESLDIDQHVDLSAEQPINDSPDAEEHPDAPPTEEPLHVTLNSAWEALHNHDYETAAQQFTQLTQENINNLAAHDGLARARVGQGALTSATTALQIAQSISPDDYTINTNLGNLLIQVGKYDKAVTTLEHALEVASDQDKERLARTHANLALALERSGVPARAAEHYAAAFELHENPNYKTRQYHALNTAGQTTSLIPEILTHAQAHPSTDLHLLAASIYHDLGDHPSRDHQVRLALERAGTHEEEARAVMYQATTNTNTAEAITQYEQAASLSPSLWQAHYNAGILALNNHNPSAAVHHLEEAAAFTTSLDTQAALGRAHLLNGNAADALHHSEAALTSSNSDVRAYAALTALHAAYQLGDYSLAVQLDTYFPSLNNPDLLIMLGTSNYELGNYSQAATQLQAAYAMEPTPALKHTLAFAYLAAYQAGNALPLLQDLANENPLDGQLQHALGWAYQMTNNSIDSQLAFRRANALGY